MKAVIILIALALVGSIAVARQSQEKPAATKSPATMSAPAKPAGGISSRKKAGPLAITRPAGEKAAQPVASNAPEPKISKEQAGTTALGTVKGAELVGSDLRSVNGKQVWAVTLKANKHNRTVLVDANDGSIVKAKMRHSMHAMHKSAGNQAPKN